MVDRMVQEAVRQVLEPLYEPTFHDACEFAIAVVTSPPPGDLVECQ